MILHIDTTKLEPQISLFRSDNFDLIACKKIENGGLSEKLLAKIEELLSSNKIKLNDLELVLVNCGPGSYTGLRIGVTTANFLALSLNIPVSAVNSGEREEVKKRYSQKSKYFDSPVLPVYQSPPHITKNKSRL